MELAMIGEEIVGFKEAQINAHDRGLYFGDGVYEVVLCRKGRIFALEEHLERLKNSLAQMDMLDRVNMEQIRGRLQKALNAGGEPDCIIYFHITRGSAPRTHDYSLDWKPNFLLTLRPWHEKPSHACKCITQPDLRWKRCDIKSLNLLPNILAKHEATKAGAYEAILVDEKGYITEGTASSVLLVKDKVLWTAPLTANILPGITRAFMLKWAGEFGLSVREELFTIVQAMAAEELMITGTGAEVMAVTHLDGKLICADQPGTYARKFQRRLEQAMEGG